MKKFTHTGVLIGASNCAPKGFQKTIKLRELKRYWVSESGKKYDKTSGWPIGETWAHYALDTETIKPITEPISPSPSPSITEQILRDARITRIM